MFQNREVVRTGLKIRLIERDDNSIVADIIRLVMTEFHAVGLGYSSNDSEIDDMYTAYAPDRSAFYVVELNGQMLGCGGFVVATGGLVSCVKCISALNYGVWG
jgi:putative acetyltransferase